MSKEVREASAQVRDVHNEQTACFNGLCAQEGEQRLNAQNENYQKGLYRSEFEHDACGIGALAHLKGKRTHQMAEDA